MEKFIVSDMACETACISDRYSTDTVNISKNVKRNIIYFGEKETVFTFFTMPVWKMDVGITEEIEIALARDLSDLMKRNLRMAPSIPTVLVVGLGNKELTPDRIGSETIQHLFATRHLSHSEKSSEGYSLACFASDVIFNTGIETTELIRGVVKQLNADILIVVDSLATRNYKHLGAAFQISEVGICPGSGVESRKGREINRETMGIPVISIGMSTVMNCATMIVDSLKHMNVMEKEQTDVEMFLEPYREIYVTPKEIDVIVKEAGFILASAIHRACLFFHHK